MMPKSMGLLYNGAAAAMIVIVPFDSPELPIPAMARPMMSISEDWAAPQSTEPNSNTPRKVMNVYLYVSVRNLSKC